MRSAVGCDTDLERALVSEALRRYGRFQARGLAPSDFSSMVNRTIVEAAETVYTAGDDVNVESVALNLQRTGKDALCGGIRGLAEIVANVSVVPDGDRLKELTALRAAYDVAVSVMKHAEVGDLRAALGAMADVDQLGRPSAKTLTAVDLARECLKTVKDSAEMAKRRVYLGMERLHNALGLYPVGSMLIVGADTNVGKTSFALEMMLGSAQSEHKTVVGMISVEDDASVTGARLLGAVSNVSSREIQRDEYEHGKERAFTRMSDGIKILNELGGRFLFEDQIGGHELDICASMSRMAMKGARMIIVDYIGEIVCSKAAQDRRNEIRIIAKRLKAHARRLGVALVLLSQITVEKQGDSNRTAPSKHALRESRDLANSAETVIMLWRKNEGDWEDIFATVVKSKWGGVNEWWRLRRSKESGRLEELGA